MATTIASATADTSVIQRTRLRFVAGMPGLEEYTVYTLVGIDGEPLYWLQAKDQPEIALPVADAFAIEPDYTFELSAADAAALKLTDAAETLVLVVLSTQRESGELTANLLAPIVVNRGLWIAKQVILDGTEYSLRHPVAALSA